MWKENFNHLTWNNHMLINNLNKNLKRSFIQTKCKETNVFIGVSESNIQIQQKYEI